LGPQVGLKAEIEAADLPATTDPKNKKSPQPNHW